MFFTRALCTYIDFKVDFHNILAQIYVCFFSLSEQVDQFECQHLGELLVSDTGSDKLLLGHPPVRVGVHLDEGLLHHQLLQSRGKLKSDFPIVHFIVGPKREKTKLKRNNLQVCGYKFQIVAQSLLADRADWLAGETAVLLHLEKQHNTTQLCNIMTEAPILMKELILQQKVDLQ